MKHASDRTKLRQENKGKERGARDKKRKKKKMGYVLRVRLASFFTGASIASCMGLYVLYKDYKIAHQSISHQIKSLHDSFDGRISALENLKQSEATEHVEATE